VRHAVNHLNLALRLTLRLRSTILNLDHQVVSRNTGMFARWKGTQRTHFFTRKLKYRTVFLDANFFFFSKICKNA
jgi:hypothetical protein